MNLDFVNRVKEQEELAAAARKGGLLVIFGRRRVGKSRLLRQWLAVNGGMYSQAIEGPQDMQIKQVFEDIKGQLGTQIMPKTWPEMFEVLSLQKKPWVLCLDEFPYLTATDGSLPSQLQRWIDQALPKGCLLILAGSSTRMMNDLFLNRSAPLYGRAHKLLQVKPMDYEAFCQACGLKAAAMASFDQFSLVGGIPKYWEFVEKGADAIALAEALYFDFAPYMEQEPQRILRDEGVIGANAVSVLEAVGRGAERPSEIAMRLGTAQTNLSRLLQQLLDASVLERELPYGESVRTTKKILYRIADPTMRFWFRVYSPHRSRWMTYTEEEKQKLIHDHASTVFEDMCRARYPGASRYWEKNFELDLVAPDPEHERHLLVAEVKWHKLSASERRQIQSQLENKWQRCALATKYPKVRVEVFDASALVT
ncbi:MAG: ATP-binding protein [Verrucomicrobiaceae bacterium]|nr:ATP-binding protein [Verrucomicrobiaceae bacterium]